VDERGKERQRDRIKIKERGRDVEKESLFAERTAFE
jgi:hypothetical protein